MAGVGEITQLTQVGDMKYENVVEAIEMCVDGCTKIHELMTKQLIEAKNKKSKK